MLLSVAVTASVPVMALMPVLVLVRVAVDQLSVSVGVFMDQISPQEKIRVG